MKNLKKILMVVTFIVLSQLLSNATAQDDESEGSKIIWSCKKPYTKDVVLWLVEWGNKSYIKVFDERIPAVYKMSGLEKRWNWELDVKDSTYKYAITLGPDRSALYFDFTTSKDGTAKSRDTYTCSK